MSDELLDPCDETQWIVQRIAAKRALIVQYEAAIAAMATGAQSYQLNTGQTQQLVTRANLGSMRIALRGFEADLAALQAQLRCGPLQMRPGW